MTRPAEDTTVPTLPTAREPRLQAELGRLLRFGLVGVSNTAVGLGTVYLCWHGLGWPDLVANPAGFAVALGWSYLLNRRFTFRSQQAHASALWRFVLVSGSAYAMSLLVLLLARHSLSVDSFLPHLCANVAYTLLAFLGYRFVVFRT